MAKRVLGLLLGLVVALALLAAGATAVSCFTNGASPTQGDANNCVQYIRQLGSSECKQITCGSDRCTVMHQSGTARVKICGDCNKSTRCSTAGDALNNVLAQCVANVGGTARVAGTEGRDGFTFVIERAPGTKNELSEFDVSCKTNGDAPSQRDANTVVQYLRSHGDDMCKQNKCDGDKCTVLRREGDAQAKICGGKCNDGPKCIVAGDALNEVLAQCVANVGGKALVAGESEAEGYRFVLEKASGRIISREPSCTTNGDSPTQSDANECVQYIRSLGNSECKQKNCNGDRCTLMYQKGSARVMICGECGKSTRCITAGDALNEVLAQCVANVGGKALVSGRNEADGLEYVLEHSSGRRVGSSPTCTTNGDSPTQREANDAVQYIRSLGNSECKQKNCNGDKCTTMYQSGHARVRLCGDCNKSTKCVTAGDALNEILAQCVANVHGTTRVSGKNNVEGFTVVLDDSSNGNIRMVSDE